MGVSSYFYTENFESNNFELYQAEGSTIALVPQDNRHEHLYRLMSARECSKDVGDDGVSVEGRSFWRAVVAYKIRVAETSPQGRGRLVFGWAEMSGLLDGHKLIDEIMTACNAYLHRTSLTVPEARKECFVRKLAEVVNAIKSCPFKLHTR